MQTPLVDQEVSLSSSAIFTCTIQAMDKLVVTWYLKGNKLLQPSHNIQIDSCGSEHQLTIQSVSNADIGQYTCYAENLSGEVSTTALLKLRGKNLLFSKWKQFRIKCLQFLFPYINTTFR